MSNAWLKELPVQNLLPIKDSGLIWLGAISFEERASTSLVHLSQAGYHIECAFLLDYQSGAKLDEAATAQRELVRSDMLAVVQSGQCRRTIEVPLEAYSFAELEKMLDTVVKDAAVPVVVDISCMTKLHVLATASCVTRLATTRNLRIAYTRPETYGFVAGALFHDTEWRDVLMAPFAESGTLFNESGSRGVVLLGHEAERLMVALGEIEPSGGCLIVASTLGRPDLAELARLRNGRLVNKLMAAGANVWRHVEIDFHDQPRLVDAVAQEVTSAKNAGAPVLLFPFGPKLVVFIAACELAARYSTSTWYVYPIHGGYNADYSYGAVATEWYALAGERGAPAIDSVARQ